MESAHPFFFTSHDKFDGVMENCDRDFLEFILFDGGLADADLCSLREEVLDSSHAGTNNHGFQNDAVLLSGSPALILQVDDAAPTREGEHRDDDDSSGATTTTTTTTRRDRSKTLVSERKRRVLMKEKLYELRSLVPNITKMDKASIIADAVAYVKDLQSQAKKLEEEISMLESLSPKEEQVLPQVSHKNTTKVVEETDTAVRGNIVQVNVHEVGKGRFYVKVEGSIHGDGEEASLYSAIESLSCFDLESSNFSLNSEGFEFTVTFKVGDFSKMMNASSMKLWVMAALLKEGFQLMQTTTM